MHCHVTIYSSGIRLSCLLPGAHVVLDLLPGPTMPTLPGQAAGLLRAPVPIAEGVHGDEIQSTFQAQCPQERASFLIQTTCGTDHWHPIWSGWKSAGLQ